MQASATIAYQLQAVHHPEASLLVQWQLWGAAASFAQILLVLAPLGQGVAWKPALLVQMAGEVVYSRQLALLAEQ